MIMIMITMKNEKGSALIICLVILLVMTMIGVQGMQSTTMEEKMSGNFRDRALAFEAAEAALQAGEVWLNLQPQQPVASNSGDNNVWTLGSADLSSTSLWSTSGLNATTELTIGAGGIAAAPQFLIEERSEGSVLGGKGSVETGANSANYADPMAVKYRITARGVGSQTNTVVLLQANYEKIYDSNR